MKKEITTIQLSKGQYLSEVEPFTSSGIPNNSIIHKVIPGCGAKTLEIKYTKRNSIIIVPNVPVIESKVREHNKKHSREEQILGVHKGVDVGKIDDYLNSEVTYKKILTTPEGFIFKVLQAFENDLERMKTEYFLLFDECERIVTDVSYRGKIAAPIDWFFQFDKKAMVSATTLPFTHEGFADFDHYFIEPTYDFSKAIKVINTNNVIDSLEGYLAELKGGEPVFIFINSTVAIHSIVETLNIKQVSNAYCAETSVAKLLIKKFKSAYSTLDISGLAKYNFLTSRYFSALDIELNYKPNVVMITDVFTANHSILDTHTEIVQIAGRFRNGVGSLSHITNFDPLIESKTKGEALQYLRGLFDTYEGAIQSFKTAKDDGVRDAWHFFVENSPIADYYTDNKFNPFMVDNFIYQHRVQGYYQRFENLKLAYSEQSNHFNPKYNTEEYFITDEDRNRILSKISLREQQWETLRQIDRLTIGSGSFKIRLSPTYSLTYVRYIHGLLKLMTYWGLKVYKKLAFQHLRLT